MQTSTVRHLSTGWQFKQTDTEEWMPVARVPTNVHLDLEDNKKIEDPFVGFNELKCEWVGDKSWTYRTILPPLSAVNHGAKHVLAFDGLDTYATVKLNGIIILKSDNMFIMYRVQVTDMIHTSRDNVLEIEFKSALLESRKIKDAHPEHRWTGSNGDMARLAVRKAQYHYGWDLGPILMTCGPWREIRLETFQARVDDLQVEYHVDASLEKVSGIIKASVEGKSAKLVDFSASLQGKEVFRSRVPVDSDGHARVEFHITGAKLWYPREYGEQTLYDVTATVTTGEHDLHTASKRTGFRKVELVQELDNKGKSFYFRLNGIDIFCGGSDWIPADYFTPRITKAKYRKWLEVMADGNQTMVRVWGGGIWEDDYFYDLCDELGILVWQDFMFACGNYPTYPKMLNSITEECICQTKRLRHHPSLIIYAGNSEDYQEAEFFCLTYNYEDKDPQSWLKTDFPARFIYEKLLPELISAHSPHVLYHPGSPWGDGKISSDRTVGDMHPWSVWHGTLEKYQIFDTLGGRFNSEFGMEAFPHIETINYYVTDPSQLYPQSHVLDFHNKAHSHERRLATYMVENFRTNMDLEKFIHLTQLSQSEALTFGYRGWRRQWGQKRHCGGALVWSLNDCWPVTSWAIVDYFLRKKPAYYAMKRALTPVAVAVKRAHHDWSVDHARPAKTSDYECWVVSSRLEDITATVELRHISISTGKEVKPASVKRNVAIVANGTTDILTGTIDNERYEPHVLAARIWVNEEVVSRDVDWPQPLKYLDFSDRGVEVTTLEDTISVKASKPTKGLVFEEREGVLLSDSAFDVVPGDVQKICIGGVGLNGKALKWIYLGAP